MRMARGVSVSLVPHNDALSVIRETLISAHSHWKAGEHVEAIRKAAEAIRIADKRREELGSGGFRELRKHLVGVRDTIVAARNKIEHQHDNSERSLFVSHGGLIATDATSTIDISGASFSFGPEIPPATVEAVHNSATRRTGPLDHDYFECWLRKALELSET